MTAAGGMPMAVTLNKDGKRRVTGTGYSLNGYALNYTYGYGTDWRNADRLSKVSLANRFDSDYEYDNLGRLTQRKLYRANGPVIKDTYTYKDAVDPGGAAVGTTGYLDTVEQEVNGTVQNVYQYTYDRNGNITEITGGPQGTVTYAYDGLDRLTSEQTGNGSPAYRAYDAGGNITSKTVNGVTTYYGYGNGWKDRLTSYGGQAVTYDECGNPLSYRGAAMTWARGRMLDTYTKGSDTVNCVYDAGGYRVKKTAVVGGATEERRYWLNGGRILGELYNDEGFIVYYYDAGGICGMNVMGVAPYYFRRNPQGDVTHIYNSPGGLVGSYTYDAWGVCTIVTDVNGIASLNPWRYRGYYWDYETGLYYLNSRYYDPEVGRFINADSVAYLEPEAINGLNLYAYCWNDPVSYVDPNGQFAIFWAIGEGLWAFISLLFGVGGVLLGSKSDPFSLDGKSGGFNLLDRDWDNLWAKLTLFGIVAGEITGISPAVRTIRSWFASTGTLPLTSNPALPWIWTDAWTGTATYIGDLALPWILLEAEHEKNPTPSNLPRHQKGKAAKQRDKGKEKADIRRRNYRKNAPKATKSLFFNEWL